eukprot:GHVU01167288.1.p1 GENE.GHVU01167288.1~~GHVU01167288.1.p1  ORF type:complete len:470 (-),score=78.06 GHVU01167288.1:101-1510(-)
MPPSLPNFLFAFLPSCLPACVCAYLPAGRPSCLLARPHICLLVDFRTCTCVCLRCVCARPPPCPPIGYRLGGSVGCCSYRYNQRQAEQRLRLTRGARVVCAALKMMGYKLALVSNGIGDIARVVGKELNFDYVLSNQLAVSEDGKMTGKLCGEGAAMRAEHLLDPWRKLDWLKLLQDKEGIAGADIVYIGGAEGGGGGATEGGGGVGEEGVSLSFLRGNCCYHIPFDVRRHGDLRSVLYLMGLSGNDVHEFVDVVRAQRRDMTVESEPLREPMYPWGDAKQLFEPQQGGDRRRRRSAGASLPSPPSPPLSPPPSHRPQRSANASSPGLHGGLANALEIVREEVAEGGGGNGDNERGGEAADVIVATAAAAGSTASHGLSAECRERSPPDARAGRHKLTTDSIIMTAPPKAAVVTKAIVHVYGSYRSGAFSRLLDSMTTDPEVEVLKLKHEIMRETIICCFVLVWRKYVG